MTNLLVEASLRSLLFAAVVGLGLTVFRVRNVPMRKLAWTLVLVVSLSMPLILRLPATSGMRVKLPWAAPAQLNSILTAPQPVAAVSTPSSDVALNLDLQPAQPTQPTTQLISLPASDLQLSLDSPARVRRARQMPPFRQMISWIYLCVAAVLLLRLLAGVFAAARLWMTADLVSPLVAPEPNVRASAKIPAPVTVGSGIVLPAAYSEWDHAKLRMIIAHERAHVRQMDFYLQLLAGLYAAIFWFSPLGWWLRRTLCSLGEAIGDRAGMEAAATRSRYAETLLEIAALPHKALPGVAMARSANLSQRVESMLNERQHRQAFIEGKLRAAASLCFIPLAMIVALALVRVPDAAGQSVQPAQQPAQPQQTDTQPQKPATGQSTPAEDQVTTTKPSPDVQPAPPAPASVVTPSAPVASDTTPDPPGQSVTPSAVVSDTAPDPPGQSVTPSAPPAPGTPAAPPSDDQVSPPPADDQSTGRIHRHGYMFHYGWDGDSYAIVTGANQTITMTSDGDQMAELEKARRSAKGPFLWFTHEGKSYIVTDPEILSHLQQMYAPMDELGKQQADLGRQQRELGRREEELGREQREAGAVEMPDMSREMANLRAALAGMQEAEQHQWDAKKWADVEAEMKSRQKMTEDQVAEIQSHLAAMMAQLDSQRADVQVKIAAMRERIAALHGEAGGRMGEFGSRMGDMGAQMGKLGEQQGRLGEQQGRIARQLNREVQKIIEDTLANGKAKPIQ